MVDPVDSVAPTSSDARAGWRAAFLDGLQSAPNVSQACRGAGIARSTAYEHRENSVEFRQCWDDAISSSVDALEAACFDRATKGVRRDRYYKGDRIGSYSEFSDGLAVTILKAYKPDLYRDGLKPVVADEERKIEIHLHDRPVAKDVGI